MADRKKKSLKTLVGEETYAVWTQMLHALVPDGRTRRLAIVVAAMLQYALDRYGDNPEEDSVAHSLLIASEANEPNEAFDLLHDVVEQLFRDAKVKYQRVNRRGQDYSIVENAILEFIHWHDMPWER